MNNKTLIVAIVALSVVVGLAAFIYPQLSSQQLPASPQSAPSSSALTAGSFSVTDATGNTVSFEDIAKGKPVFVNFWATWCPYCVDEMDDIEQLYGKYGDKVEFAIIDSVDGQRETREMGQAYIAEHGYTFPVYYDEAGEALGEFAVNAFPTSVLISSDGSIAHTVTGRFDAKSMDKALAGLA